MEYYQCVLPLSQSGYRKFSRPCYEIIIDGGPIGPDYIPGHGHADILNFELHIQEKPFIVDLGISTYEKNKKRLSQRSTSAHNTVTIGKQEQSEIWSGFQGSEKKLWPYY